MFIIKLNQRLSVIIIINKANLFDNGLLYSVPDSPHMRVFLQERAGDMCMYCRTDIYYSTFAGD